MHLVLPKNTRKIKHTQKNALKTWLYTEVYRSKIKIKLFVLEKLVKINGYCLKYIPNKFKDDINLALLGIC